MRMFSHCLALDAICTTTTAPSERWQHTQSEGLRCMPRRCPPHHAKFSVLPCDIITRNDWDDARLSKSDHARQKAAESAPHS